MGALLISVVVATRNRRALLARALRTVAGQEGVELELIVVDDGSVDGTAAWLAGLGDPRVVVIRHDEPQGVARARNAGLARASAGWVAFVDDDDVWAPSKLAAQLEACRRRSAAWAIAGAVVLDRDLQVRAAQRFVGHERFLPLLLGHNVVPGGASGVVASADLVRSVGGFDPALRIMADWDLWIRLALEAPVAVVDRPLVGYVLHGANMTSAPAGFRRELARIREKHRAARERHGVRLNDRSWSEWLSEVQRRSGLRVRPALAQARIAVRHRRPRAVARAAAIALRPGWLERRDAWRLERIPPDWLAEADAWLGPLRAGGREEIPGGPL